MSKATLSKEYISDSESESVHEDDSPVQSFEVPKQFKKIENLKKFPTSKKLKENKEELWLIKVPTTLDISTLKTLPINKDSKLSSVIELKGEKRSNKAYSISESVVQHEGSDSSNFSLLVPDEERTSLKLSNKNKSLNFDRVFTINEMVKIPEIAYDKIRVPRENVVKPKNLTLKHFATGYSASDFGLEDEQSNKSKKRKSSDVINEETHKEEQTQKEEPATKKKKEKKDKKDKKKKKKEKNKLDTDNSRVS
ncbi:hypothetical protein TBLA_0B06540 [Henningerozyma blattae CBS 6284]|uniref:DNA-directed RNA polymerase I subunit RPA34 n=1 Tax=Henningerozyma blattae (strain ATCC 34711 / CBS 6284 / DSM 70876 / NBRC 10599 / NRRL Y-10934 / UCD 77-7) TaxID=1071380 RepID=I2GZC5_HENB6|nr:hypothetical protein TBLA_0B06540 [Tetrapisispora blattae CBS 6284]CCH59477.1 hypothetical protein TBLA_0B06540 [Tetrapisispora blattae CBS 6284]